MQYDKRTVRSRPGLTQEEALESLQSHPQFTSGTKISAIRRRGKVWVADLLEPKTAGPFPPSDEGSSEGPPPPDESSGEESGPPSDDSGSDDGGEGGPPSDSPDGPPGEGEGEEGGKGGTDQMILHTLQQILHALQGGPVDDGMGGPDPMGPDIGGPPAPHGPHGGPGAGGLPPGGPHPGAAGIGAKLKPGEVKNGPGVTPVGAPAFASVAGRAATFKASRPATVSIRTAHAELEGEYGPLGYKVARMRVEGDRIVALMTRR